MKTDRLHGDVISEMSVYHERDHELLTADIEVPGYRPGWPADELTRLRAGDEKELTGGQVDRLLQVALRPDTDVAGRRPAKWRRRRSGPCLRTRIAGAGELTADCRCPGTMVTGAVHTRGDHDLATATVCSAAGITAVEDCLDVAC